MVMMYQTHKTHVQQPMELTVTDVPNQHVQDVNHLTAQQQVNHTVWTMIPSVRYRMFTGLVRKENVRIHVGQATTTVMEIGVMDAKLIFGSIITTVNTVEIFVE